MERMIKSFDDLCAEQYGQGVNGNAAIRDFQANMLKAMYGPRYTDAMAKAVATTPGVSPGGILAADSSPLMLQNLDNVLTSVLFTEEHFELFGTFPRVPSLNLNYQFDKRLSYGGGRRSPGFVEGGSPVGGVSSWERDSAQIRFMGVRRGITQQLMQVGQMGGMQLDPVAEENRNGTLELLEELERVIYYGDSGVKSNAGVQVNYDGLYKQIANSPYVSTNFKDMQGAPMYFEDLEDAARLLVENYYVTSFANVRCLASPGIISYLSKLRFNIDRHMVQSGPVAPMMAGMPFKGYSSTFGDIMMKRHIFFQRVTGDKPKSALIGADAGAPATPVTVALAAAGTDALSGMPTGNLYYTVAAFDDHGESLPFVYGTPAAPTAGQHVAITITQVTGATGYRIYRGLKADGSDALWIADVADSGAGTTVYTDKNQKVPGSFTCLLWVNDPETIVVPQFMPLIKWPVAITTTTIEWFLLLYHTIVLKAPQRVILFHNVVAPS